MKAARLKLRIRDRGQPWVIFTRYVWPDGSVKQFPEPKRTPDARFAEVLTNLDKIAEAFGAQGFDLDRFLQPGIDR